MELECEEVPPCLIPDLSNTALNFQLLRMLLAAVFFVDFFFEKVKLRKLCSIPRLLNFYIYLFLLYFISVFPVYISVHHICACQP